MQSKENIKRIQEKVEYVLYHYPQARNDDRILYVQYIREWHWDCVGDRYNEQWEAVRLEDILHFPSLETMGRVRRKLQEQNKYLPTSEQVARKRNINMDEWKKAMGYNTGNPNQQRLPI